jgi:hypothetical protein
MILLMNKIENRQWADTEVDRGRGRKKMRNYINSDNTSASNLYSTLIIIKWLAD